MEFSIQSALFFLPRVKEEPQPSITSGIQSKNRTKLARSIKELGRLLDTAHTPSTSHRPIWDPSQLSQLERCLGDLSRCLSSGGVDDQHCFCQLGGLSTVARLFLLTVMEGGRRPSDK